MVKPIAVFPALAATALGVAVDWSSLASGGGSSSWSSSDLSSESSSSGSWGSSSGSSADKTRGASASSSSNASSSSSSSGSSSSSNSGTSRTTAPEGSITVCSSDCDYTTIQSAVDSVDGSSDSVIFIYAGTYSEQVKISSISGSLTIYGETEDTSSYSGNKVSIEQSTSQASGASDNKSTATLLVESANVAVYNIDIKNTYGKGSQAVALAAYEDKQGYYGVGLYGYQDTLLAQTGNQVYASCYIEGAVDFIFGQQARIWITNSDIYSSASGSITANGRDSDDNDSYYVISDSTVDGAGGSGSAYLGRPWRSYARVAFQRSSLSGVVNAAGWAEWNEGDARTDGVTFEEYGNEGDGAATDGRASFSTQMSSALDIGTILGSDYSGWVDSSYV